MNRPDLYVRNGKVVTSADTFAGGVLIKDGRILELVRGNPELEAEDTVDAQGQWIMPGLVDPHVHFSEPGRGHWEGFETGSRAAAAGGITTIIEMPLNASPPTVNVEALAMKRQAARQSLVDYALWGGLITDNRADIAPLHEAGVIAFKAFMCTGSFDFPRADDVVLEDGMRQIARLGSLIAVHAEDETLTRRLTADLRASGRKDTRAWGEARPVEAELAAIRAALEMAERTDARLHVVHVSSAAGIDLISKAKQSGLNITAETCPHYLFFSEDDLDRLGSVAKCAPPLRSRKEVETLWERVLDGKVDVIASDHSPCPWEEKVAGSEDIFEAWGGISGLQSTLSAMITEGVQKRGLTCESLVRMTSTNPARIFGLHPRKGDMASGCDADLILVNPDVRTVLTSEALFYRNPHSAYVGATLSGKVTRTILRGVTIYLEGKFETDISGSQFLTGQREPNASIAADRR